ncbi:FtsX-like permease family protein [Nocardioides sp.]|uniref:ABC transporter permease n=1 Tax=Nocardioides sp. TaxID=35761 RepID=UPI0039E35E11
MLIAASGFTVLTASSRASRLDVLGTVNRKAQLNYDLLVRPKGARTKVEQKESLIQGGYLSGISGGISKSQWRKIEQIPGVSVAAPIAMLGYVVPTVDVPVTLDASADRDSVTRLDVTWRYDNGLSVEHAAADFVFVTHRRLTLIGAGNFYYHYGSPDGPLIGPSEFVERAGLTEATRPSIMTYCSTARDGASDCGANRATIKATIRFPFPMLLAAVDPSAEAELTGLGTQLTSGSGLKNAKLTSPYTVSGKVTPVLAAAEPATELQADVRISDVGGGAVEKVLQGDGAAAMVSLPHTRTSTVSLDGSDAYRRLLKQLRRLPHYRGARKGRFGPNSLSQRFAIGTPRYHKHGDHLTPKVVPNDISQYITDKGFQTYVPAGMGDVAVRTATSIQGPDDKGIALPASVKVVGTLPSNAAAKLTDETSQILSGFLPSDSIGADSRSQRLLGHKALAPSPDVAGLVQPSPLLITTLAATDQWYRGWNASTEGRPISAIRVRVSGVHGVDPVSRERVRLVAQRIQQSTGLQVDVTLGSSATRVSVVDPPGKNGRPRLVLSQWWVKKGVATAVLRALDKKSLAISCLVLLVSMLTVANAAIASVRARRAEFGVLACLGWTRSQTASLVLREIGFLAITAGVMAVGLSYLLGAVFGTPIGIGRSLLAIPAALVVALVASLVPVWWAGRAAPMAAIHVPAPTPRRTTVVRSVLALARVNLVRNRVRTLLGACGLTVAAATLLLVVSLGFRGAVVGTVMGNAVAIQVRTADYAAVGATLLLALLGVVNVIYLNIRERSVEFAALLSMGWSARELNRSVLWEALGLGMLGTTSGVLLGVAAAAAFIAGAPLSAIGLTALICVGVGLGVTLLAALSASQLLRRLPITALLTEE